MNMKKYEITDSIEKLEAAISRTKAAQRIFATYTQDQVDKIFLAAASAADKARIPLAKMAVEETGMGVVEDKVIKNNYASEYIIVTSSDTTSPVELQLHHAFALLEFRFVNASSAAVSSVSGIALEGVQYKGSFGFSEDGTSSLSVASDLVAADSNIYVGSLSATNIPVDLSTSYNLFENMGTLVVMPQEVYHKSAELKMQVAGGVRMGVNLGNTNSVYTWEAGKKYIYTMTLTTSTITFDVSVREWIRDEVEL